MDIMPLTVETERALDQAKDLFLHMAQHEGYTSATIGQDALPILQRLYDAALEMDEDVSTLAISLGVALGEIFRGAGDFEWVRVRDEYGEENSLAVPGTSLTIHPISMITKRVARKETVDLAAMTDDICTRIGQIIAEGKYDER